MKDGKTNKEFEQCSTNLSKFTWKHNCNSVSPTEFSHPEKFVKLLKKE